MSLPRAFAQLLVLGVQITGKAVYQASRQALRNAQAGGGSAASASAASQSSNPLTQRHKMALDEALNILNVKAPEKALGEESAIKEMLGNYEHLFKMNQQSHYLQSKIVRARARIEDEVKLSKPKAFESDAAAAEQQQS